MTPYRHPGFLDNTRLEGFWPLVIVSGILHLAVFWVFGHVNFNTSPRNLPTPFAMVDLRGQGTRSKTGGGAPRDQQPAPRPPEPQAKTAKTTVKPDRPAEKPLPPPAPKPAKTSPKSAPLAAHEKPDPSPPKPAPDVKTIPKNATPIPDRAPPPKPKPQEPDLSGDPVAERIARLKEKRGSHADDPVAERIARIRDKRREANSEADVADRIAKLRERQIQGSESQVTHRIEALREKYGTREPTKETGKTGAGGRDGPLAVQGSGAQGAAGFAEAQYLRTVKEHIDLHWSIPEALKGRGYRTSVTVIVDRRGVITEYTAPRSGNRFFDERVERAVAEANPLPPVPPALPGRYFEYELRFSAP